MPRRKTIALSALLLNASLTACAHPDPPPAIQRVYERQALPDSLLTCAAEPAVPPAPVTEFAVLEYIARLRAALLDCRFRLSRVAALVEPQGPERPR